MHVFPCALAAVCSTRLPVFKMALRDLSFDPQPTFWLHFGLSWVWVPWGIMVGLGWGGNKWAIHHRKHLRRRQKRIDLGHCRVLETPAGGPFGAKDTCGFGLKWAKIAKDRL